MDISFIIPAYNAENVIERSVSSIKKSRIDADVEIIIVNDGSTDTASIQAKLDKATVRLQNLIAMRADGEISKEEYQAMRNPIDEQIRSLQKSLEEAPTTEATPKGLQLDKIIAALNSMIDFSSSTISHDIINQFVYRITPTSDSTYDWYLNLSGTAKARAVFSAEGRKKDCIIKLEEIEKISSLHTHPAANNQQHINNPLVFTLLPRPRSRMAKTKRELPEVRNFYSCF